MDFNEFQDASQRTLKHAPDYLHVAALGLASEVGEIASEIKKAAEQERDINTGRICEEAGDCLWYLSAICTLLGISLETAASGNVLKLHRRYPQGFTAQASIARADKE